MPVKKKSKKKTKKKQVKGRFGSKKIPAKRSKKKDNTTVRYEMVWSPVGGFPSPVKGDVTINDESGAISTLNTQELIEIAEEKSNIFQTLRNLVKRLRGSK